MLSKSTRKLMLAAALAVGVLALPKVESTNAADDMISFNMGFYPGATFQALIFVSDAKGFYKEAGLDPTFVSTANGPLMNTELGSGAIDIGYNAPSQVGLPREQGLDLIWTLGNARIPWVLIARNDIELPHKGQYPEVIADMKGLVWGVYGRGSDGEVFMRMMAEDAGLDVDNDVTWVGVGGPPTGLPALQVNKIQVYLTLDPAPILAENGGYGQTVLDLREGEGPADLKGIVYQGIEVLRKTAEEKPELINRMIKAHETAFCWVKDPNNFDELITILKDQLPSTGLSEEQFREMVRHNMSTLTLTFPEEHVARWNKLLIDKKVLKQPLPADVLWETIPKEDPTCS